MARKTTITLKGSLSDKVPMAMIKTSLDIPPTVAKQKALGELKRFLQNEVDNLTLDDVDITTEIESDEE